MQIHHTILTFFSFCLFWRNWEGVFAFSWEILFSRRDNIWVSVHNLDGEIPGNGHWNSFAWGRTTLYTYIYTIAGIGLIDKLFWLFGREFGREVGGETGQTDVFCRLDEIGWLKRNLAYLARAVEEDRRNAERTVYHHILVPCLFRDTISFHPNSPSFT